MEVVTFFIYAFASIFVIVNPVAGLITFISLTSGMTADERNSTVKRSVTVACLLAIVFAVSGELILRFFGVTVDCLRVAGGILLFTVALDMLHARVSRESVTAEEIRDATEGRRLDFSDCHTLVNRSWCNYNCNTGYEGGRSTGIEDTGDISHIINLRPILYHLQICR